MLVENVLVKVVVNVPVVESLEAEVDHDVTASLCTLASGSFKAGYPCESIARLSSTGSVAN